MHLSDYMAQLGLNDEAVAKEIGRSRVSVSRYRRRIDTPTLEMARKIYDWSGGKIALEDWVIREAAE